MPGQREQADDAQGFFLNLFRGMQKIVYYFVPANQNVNLKMPGQREIAAFTGFFLFIQRNVEYLKMVYFVATNRLKMAGQCEQAADIFILFIHLEIYFIRNCKVENCLNV